MTCVFLWWTIHWKCSALFIVKPRTSSKTCILWPASSRLSRAKWKRLDTLMHLKWNTCFHKFVMFLKMCRKSSWIITFKWLLRHQSARRNTRRPSRTWELGLRMWVTVVFLWEVCSVLLQLSDDISVLEIKLQTISTYICGPLCTYPNFDAHYMFVLRQCNCHDAAFCFTPGGDSRQRLRPHHLKAAERNGPSSR